MTVLQRISCLTLLLVFAGAGTAPLNAWASPPEQAADVRVTYSVDTFLAGRYTAQVSLTNMTPGTLSAWSLQMDIRGTVSGIDNATWSRTGTTVSIQGSGWTRDIPPGQVAWLTIHGSTQESSPPVPTSCAFNGASCVIEVINAPAPAEPAISDLTVAAWISEIGVTTYSGHIVIQNPTEHELPAWSLSFSSPSLITSIEHVDWERSGTTYRTTGTGWTTPVPANGFVFFSFHGVHNGTPYEPVTCRLNNVPCTFVQPDHVISTPRMEVFFKVDEYAEGLFDGYISLTNPSPSDLTSWTLRFDMVEEITAMDGVEWSRSGDSYTVRGLNGKRRVRGDGGEVIVPIEGIVDGVIEDPEDCTVNGELCLMELEGTTFTEDAGVDDDDDDGDGTDDGGTDGGDDGGGDDEPEVTCDSPASSQLPELDFSFINTTPSRYVALIAVRNTDTLPIKGWSLEFGLIENMSITRFWNGVLTETTDGYRVVNTAGNSCILPGDAVQFGFDGEHDGTFAEPIGCQFDGELCVFLKWSNQYTSTSRESTGSAVPSATRLTVRDLYPNPAGASMTVRLAAQNSGSVIAQVIDMQGRVFDTVFDGHVSAGGVVEFTVDSSGYAAGAYLMRALSADGSSSIHPFIIQR